MKMNYYLYENDKNMSITLIGSNVSIATGEQLVNKCTETQGQESQCRLLGELKYGSTAVPATYGQKP